MERLRLLHQHQRHYLLRCSLFQHSDWYSLQDLPRLPKDKHARKSGRNGREVVHLLVQQTPMMRAPANLNRQPEIRARHVPLLQA